MKIKTIKPHKQGFMTVVFVNEETLVLHRDTVVKHGLFSADTLNEKALADIKEADRFPALMQKALNLLAKEEKAYEQLKKALLKEEHHDLVQAVMDQCEALGYIDDLKALEREINDVIEFKFEGPNHVRERLKRQGFDTHDIDHVLSRYTIEMQREKVNAWLSQTLKNSREPKAKLALKLKQTLYKKGFELDAHIADIDEALNALAVDETALLEKRLLTLTRKYDLTNRKDKQKLIQKLMREGFNYDAIKAKL